MAHICMLQCSLRQHAHTTHCKGQSSSLQVGAHEVLADLLMRYMAELSSTSHSYAELAGRTATNISDVVR